MVIGDPSKPSPVPGVLGERFLANLIVRTRQRKGSYRNLFEYILHNRQGIDDELDVRSEGCCLSSRRRVDNGLFTFFPGVFFRSERMDEPGNAGHKLRH
jgi:hypothetical protein